MEGQVEKKRDMTWVKVLWNLHLHLLGLYGFFVLLTDAKWLTVLFGMNNIPKTIKFIKNVTKINF